MEKGLPERRKYSEPAKTLPPLHNRSLGSALMQPSCRRHLAPFGYLYVVDRLSFFVPFTVIGSKPAPPCVRVASRPSAPPDHGTAQSVQCLAGFLRAEHRRFLPGLHGLRRR